MLLKKLGVTPKTQTDQKQASLPLVAKSYLEHRTTAETDLSASYDHKQRQPVKLTLTSTDSKDSSDATKKEGQSQGGNQSEQQQQTIRSDQKDTGQEKSVRQAQAQICDLIAASKLSKAELIDRVAGCIFGAAIGTACLL
jgi:hypothetical protein